MVPFPSPRSANAKTLKVSVVGNASCSGLLPSGRISALVERALGAKLIAEIAGALYSLLEQAANARAAAAMINTFFILFFDICFSTLVLN